MSKNYNIRTASLKATIADIRNLNAKEINLDGKNILEYISDSEFDSYDTRDPQLKNDELDIWNTTISLSDNNHIEVKPFEHTYEEMTDEQKELLLNSAAKVIDNEVLGTNDEHLMYWQTDGLTNGEAIFYQCTNLTSFSSDLSNLTNGKYMFAHCTNFTVFSSNLSSLTNGEGMFNGCSQFTSFNFDLPNLTNGYSMFCICSNLTSFSSDLSSLTNGMSMFFGCPNLTVFSSDLSSLTNGEGMFQFCSNLTSFSSGLCNLTNGVGMFNSTKIDAPSVANIVHSLPTHESNGEIAIGIGCDDTEADQLLFAQECDCETWQELLDDFTAKNWTVTFQFNGRPVEATTYNIRRGATLPIYAKLEEVTESEHYTYTSQDGSKFHNINYFHSTNGSTEGYDVFSSLEEAISTYNVTPKN